MGESCVFKPTVRNKKGEEVESKLFNNLLNYSSNDREFAKRWYFIGTNEEFLNRNANKVKYDENGEITFQSLKNLVSLNIEEEKLFAELNKELGTGTYGYYEAMSRINSFNSNNEYNDEYMAIMNPVENGKTSIRVVRKNRTNRRILEENIENKSLFDRIRQAVERIGGDFTFIDEDYSKYDTINSQKAASGLQTVIFLSKGGNLTAEMAEEAGHFAVGALGNHPLVQRLQALCTPEVQERILKDHYRDVQGRKNPRRETAGFLVGQYINNEIDRQSVIGRLAGKIVNVAKKMFARLRSDEVGLMRLEAQKIARTIARNFMEGKDAGSIEQALQNEEVLYSATDSDAVRLFKDVLQQLSLLTSEMSTIDKITYKKWKAIESDTAIGRLFENPSAFADLAAIDGVTTAITLLADSANEMITLLNSVDTDSDRISENANALRQVNTYLRHTLSVMEIVDDLRSRSSIVVNDTAKKALKDAYDTLNNLINGDNKLANVLINKQKALYLNFLKDLYGEEYVMRSDRVLFNSKTFKLERVKGGPEYLSRLLETFDSDENLLSRYFSSMSDSADIINQLAYKAKAAAQEVADQDTRTAWDTLREMHTRFRQHKFKAERFMETDKNGKLTGNYISRRHWGNWENAWMEFKEQCKKEFYEDPAIEGKSRIEQEYLWELFFTPRMKKWHKVNSEFDKATGKWMPSLTLYKNDDYDRLTAEEKSFLKEILDFKGELDNHLTYESIHGYTVETAHTLLHRMPQFRGSTQNRISNMMGSESTVESVLHALRQNVVNTFVANSEDRDFGSNATHNTIDEDVFSDKLEFEKSKFKRVALFGINKLKDTSEVSTDIFASLLQYAAMVHTYTATSSIVDILETGKEVLGERKVKGLVKEKNREKHSGTYSRYIDFLDAEVYNLGATQKSFGKLALSKIIGFFSGLASKIYLGGNVAGGAVNFGTGFLEILKEAVAGETFTYKEWVEANKIYWQCLPANLLQAGKDVKNDKVSLFMREFNVRSDFGEQARSWSTRKSRLTRINPFGDNLFLPYKSGDHYMQAMSFLAAAQHYKFVDANNNEMSLWDAYVVVDIDPSNPKAGKTIKMKKGLKFKDKNGNLRDWDMQKDKIDFQLLCRQVNIRLHGIYNRIDKTAFHKQYYGQAVLSMRGYALGLLQNNFSTNHYSVALGRESDGKLVTLLKFIANMLPIVGGKTKYILPSLRAMLLPFGESTKNSVLSMGFSLSQYNAMRRNFMDFAFISILGMLKTLTKSIIEGGGDDDDPYAFLNDDEDSAALGRIYYCSNRLYNEQNAYKTPVGLWNEQKQILDLIPSGAAVTFNLAELGYLVLSGEEYKQDSKLHEAGDKKWKYRIGSYIPWYRSIRVWEHPYESAKAYEYGRATYK